MKNQSCPWQGKGLLCNYNSLNLLWKLFHTATETYVFMQLQTWNWIVYLITLLITVRDWGRGCYVIISLWTCYENYFTQRPKLTCLCNYTDMKLNCVPYYLTHNCPRLGRGCYVIITLWTCYENNFTQRTKLTCLCNYTDMKLNYVPYYLTHSCPRLGKGLLCNYNSLNLLWKLFYTATKTYIFYIHEIELCTLLPYAKLSASGEGVVM